MTAGARRLLITHRAGGAGRALYQPLLLRLKELGSPGLLLSGDPLEGVLLGGQRATPQPPGGAYWSGAATARPCSR